MPKRKLPKDDQEPGPIESGELTDADLYSVLRKNRHPYDAQEIARQFSRADETRVLELAASLQRYIGKNLPDAISKRKNLTDYRTNPYVLLTSASVMRLVDATSLGKFLFNTKLYMGLETSFGKSIEAAFIGHYPVDASANARWEDPQEKVAEFAALKAQKLTREQKARARNNSVWREIDKSCVNGKTRYLISIKSGPACINDTQVAGMVTAIAKNYPAWMEQTQSNYPGVTELNMVVGITYGTEISTNNKENQILAKLQEHGFTEEDRINKPGILLSATGSVRVYRCIGQGFWSFIGNPANPRQSGFVFVEVLLALSKALAEVMKTANLEDKVNARLTDLAQALLSMRFPRPSLPEWVRKDFTEDELFWLAVALVEFFDH